MAGCAALIDGRPRQRLPAAAGGARRALLRAVLALAMLAGLSACTTVLSRSAVPEDAIDRAKPYGIDDPLLRVWGDALTPENAERIVALRAKSFRAAYSDEIARGEAIRHVSLALSGGGPDGAFGAGLLAGWTARGDRPEFDVVTGVSTGAILAIFAFLGPEYDDTLREIYTAYETDDLVVRTLFAGLTGGTALLDTRGYRALIERYLDDAVMAEIAEAYRRNRLLLIGTTNIDASRPVIWNIGAIAASGHPQARRLVHDVLQASSAIPAAFPPAIIPVEAGGRSHDEMHVDGGATQQVMLYSPALRTTDIDEALGVEIDRTVYVVMNNKLSKPYSPVRPRVFSIAGTAASSLIGGSGSGDIYRIFTVAQRDGLDLRITAIPPGFDAEPEEMFDPAYMTALYEFGEDIGRSGEAWSSHPPDYAVPR
jgi:predicted acylesterase/phospholipase RssA